jgi:hypothetical protein
MNATILTQLKVIVERAVRPVLASPARKRQMREELLAHLVGTFEEELERLGDEESALRETTRRFGDPRELSSQIQLGVPRWDRLRAVSDKFFRYEPGESLLHFAGKCVILGLLNYPLTLLLVLPFLLIRRNIEFATLAHVLFVCTMVSAVLAFVLGAGGMQMARAVYGGGTRRHWGAIIAYSLASLTFFPLITLLIYGGLLIDLSTSLFYLRVSCCLAPLAPVLLLGMAHCVAEEVRHEEEWGSLQIDG